MERMVKCSEHSEGYEVLENVWNMNWTCMIKMQKKVYLNIDNTTLQTAFMLSIRLGTIDFHLI